jgi:DNA primase
VMAADQAGYSECVAVLGTALTPDHARQLGNLVGGDGRLLLLLDGDAAGKANGLKGVHTCMSVGVPVQVALLPQELDPAELLAEGQAGLVDGQDPAESLRAGKLLFERVLGESRPDLMHLLRTLAPRPYELDHQRRLAVLDEILVSVRAVPDQALQALHLRDCADYFGIPRERIEARMAAAQKPAAGLPNAGDAPAAAAVQQPLPTMEDAILHILAQCPDLRAHAGDDLALEPAAFPGAWQALAFALLQESTDVTALLALPEVHADLVLREAAYRWVQTPLCERRPVAIGDARACLDEHVAQLMLRQLQDQLLRLSRGLAEAASGSDPQAMGRLIAERIQLERRIKDLRGLSDGAA